MEAIRIKRKVKSSTLKIKELEKFKDRDVLISITPILPESISSEKEVTKEQLKEELLTISVWDIIEEDLKNVVIKNKDKSKKIKVKSKKIKVKRLLAVDRTKKVVIKNKDKRKKFRKNRKQMAIGRKRIKKDSNIPKE